MRRRLIALTVLSAFTLGTALSACGVKGDLERPEPIFGKKDKTAQISNPPAP